VVSPSNNKHRYVPHPVARVRGVPMASKALPLSFPPPPPTLHSPRGDYEADQVESVGQLASVCVCVCVPAPPSVVCGVCF